MVQKINIAGCRCSGCNTQKALATRQTFTREEVATLIALALDLRADAHDLNEAHDTGWSTGWLAGWAARDTETDILMYALGGQGAASYKQAVDLHQKAVEQRAARDAWDNQAKADYAAQAER